MPNLIVAGCSCSDRHKVKKSYGDYIAHSLGLNYIHEARSCGSNFTIWRVITKMILDKKITANDIVLIQYTHVSRHEFISNVDPITPTQTIECYNLDSWLVRYKTKAWEWVYNPHIKKFLKLYEKYMTPPGYSNEIFIVNNYNFQCMLAQNNINAFFLDMNVYMPEEFTVIPYFKNRVFTEQLTDKTLHNKSLPNEYSIDELDRGHHLNKNGHKIIATEILKFIY